MDDLEADVRALLAAGDLSAAATMTIQRFGPELVGMLQGISGDAGAAQDAFSLACERIWLGLPRFRGEGALRTWCYTIARNAMREHWRSPHNAPKRRVPMSAAPEALELADRIYSSTSVYRKTDVKDRMRALRDELEPEDQLLLVLRVDRDMAWNDIATIMAEPDAAADDLKRVAAALRKRYERVKAKLRDRAIATGLLDPGAT